MFSCFSFLADNSSQTQIERIHMIKMTSAAALVASLLLATAPNYAFADSADNDFTFSEALQEQLDTFREARETLRDDIRAALEGLTREEAREVRQSYAEDVQGLRETGRSLRESASSELEEAGIEPPERSGPGRGGEGRGGPGGGGGPRG
jgi:outer membrane murein-binding lipoprotein Lpp